MQESWTPKITQYNKAPVNLVPQHWKGFISTGKWFGRLLKSSMKLVKYAADQAKAENERSNRSVWWKVQGKRWEAMHFVLLQNWLQKQDLVKLQCVESSNKTLEPIFTKYRKGNFQLLMNVWHLTDVNTFWISWKMEWCPIWCSLMRRNLMFSNA